MLLYGRELKKGREHLDILSARFSLSAARERRKHLQQRKLPVDRQEIFSSWVSSLTRCLLSQAYRLPDHLVRAYQHIRGNRQTDLLGCFQIDNELELYRLLDR